jgi:hypothetical protein
MAAPASDNTNLGDLLNGRERRRVELGSETLEPGGLVHVLGLGGPKLAQSAAEDILGHPGLHLDNVLARDDLGPAGLDDGREPGCRERGSEAQRQGSEKGGKVHGELSK